MSIPVTPEFEAQVTKFTVQNSNYYNKQFALLGQVFSYRASFNLMATLFGPLWYGGRNLWGWVIPFAVLEIIACVLIAQGLWGDLGYAERMRSESITKTIEMRQTQLVESLETGADNVAALQRVIKSLEKSVRKSQVAAQEAQASSSTLIGFGVLVLIFAKLLSGVIANWALEGRFRKW